jgi:hypothetical protein
MDKMDGWMLRKFIFQDVPQILGGLSCGTRWVLARYHKEKKQKKKRNWSRL